MRDAKEDSWTGEDDLPLTEEAKYKHHLAELQHEMVVKMYMKTFGQHLARDQWDSTKDLVGKDELDSEKKEGHEITRKSAS
jgi:hypothetical protein